MEVLIVQMGKVASTAIAEALRRNGLEASQAHIASPDRLKEKLTIMTGPFVGESVAQRMYSDYLQELRVTFLLARQRIGAGSLANIGGEGEGPDDESPEDVRVISLTRDPLSWYWSHFAQNYDHYGVLLRKYAHHHRPGLQFDPEQTLSEMQEMMFSVLEDTRAPLDDSEALPQLMSEADQRDPTGVVFSQINRFLVPLRWFKEDFLPATEVDVYAHAFNRARGSAVMDSGRLQVLLLRYENLVERAPDIASFVGIESLDLQRANVSEDKNIPFNIKLAQQRGQAMISQGLIDRIYATRYARHFGYSQGAFQSGSADLAATSPA